MESTNMSMTSCARLRTVALASAQTELMRTSSGRFGRHMVPGYVATRGTALSAFAPAAVKANALLPISDVVVFGDNAGIRTWSPPV